MGTEQILLAPLPGQSWLPWFCAQISAWPWWFPTSPGDIKSKIHAVVQRAKDEGPSLFSHHEFVPFSERAGKKGALQKKDKIGYASFPQALPPGSGTWEARRQTGPEKMREKTHSVEYLGLFHVLCH